MFVILLATPGPDECVGPFPSADEAQWYGEDHFGPIRNWCVLPLKAPDPD